MASPGTEFAACPGLPVLANRVFGSDGVYPAQYAVGMGGASRPFFVYSTRTPKPRIARLLRFERPLLFNNLFVFNADA